MKIAFELSDRDLNFFRKALKQSRHAVRDADESEIIDAIRDVLDEIRKNEPLPDFVSVRIPQLESLRDGLPCAKSSGSNHETQAHHRQQKLLHVRRDHEE